MKTLYRLLFLILLMISLKSEAQQIIISPGTIPTIDGVMSAGEWNDAKVVTIYVQTEWEVEVYYKHSDSSLFFAFTGLKGVYGERYPDILLDINNDKHNSWNTDDWWFHTSYNDCEGHGIYNNWTSCIPSHPGWFANNFPITEPGIIEIEISYAKIGISNKSADTLGIAFEVSDTYNDYHYYPSIASIDNPSTWTIGIISFATTISDKYEGKNEIKIFPNPSSNSTTIQFSNPNNVKHSLTIYNTNGQIIHNIENITGSEVQLENINWVNGLYYFKLQNNNGKISNVKFIKE